MINDNYNTSKI